MKTPIQSGESRDTAVAQTSIFAIIVLYKQLPAASVSLNTLLASLAAVPAESLRFHLFIVDNTPGGQSIGPLPEGVSYRAAPSNPGLSIPYNDALRIAARGGYSWLLTLDQDTDLPVDFLCALRDSAQEYESDQRVAAVVPHIVDNERPISPLAFRGGFWPRVLPLTAEGIGASFTSAVNSGSLLRVSSLLAIGGYDERFPLHNSDTTLFHRIGQAGLRVAIMRSPVVRHELAIMDRGQRMTSDRYRQLLVDERACWDLYMGFWGRVERWLRLAVRLALDKLHGRNEGMRAATLQELRLRLFTRKRDRIRTWTVDRRASDNEAV